MPSLTYRDLQRTVFLAFALYAVAQFAGALTTLLLFFLLVFILAAVMNPAVTRLEARGVPRIAGALLLASAVIGVLSLIGYLALPPLLREVTHFFEGLDDKQARLAAYYADLTARFPWLADHVPDPATLLQSLAPKLGGVLGQVGRYTANLLVGILSLFLLMVLVVFTAAHPEPLVTGLLAATPERNRPKAINAIKRILDQLKNWAYGSLVLGFIVGLMTAIGLAVLGKITGHAFPYILLFSVIAGVGELVPNVGPILSAFPPALVALAIDPLLALWVVLLFVLIQQAENNLIVPLVMGQSLNLHPISVTFAVLVMGVLFGLIGAILAVPTCAILKVCWEEFYLKPSQTDPGELRACALEIIRGAAAPARPSYEVHASPVERAAPEAAQELKDADAGTN